LRAGSSRPLDPASAGVRSTGAVSSFASTALLSGHVLDAEMLVGDRSRMDGLTDFPSKKSATQLRTSYKTCSSFRNEISVFSGSRITSYSPGLHWRSRTKYKNLWVVSTKAGTPRAGPVSDPIAVAVEPSPSPPSPPPPPAAGSFFVRICSSDDLRATLLRDMIPLSVGLCMYCFALRCAASSTESKRRQCLPFT